MIYAILIGLAVIIIVAFLVFVSKQPDNFLITRSEAISAPAAIPFALVNNLHKWVVWSPWEGIDADLKRTYGGPDEGVGANYDWEGKKTGAGAMRITKSEAPSLLRMDLNFRKPFAASNQVEFTFSPRGDHTIVTWAMSGKDNFGAKLFCLICNRDKMCGDMFLQGLAKLKAESEKSS